MPKKVKKQKSPTRGTSQQTEQNNPFQYVASQVLDGKQKQGDQYPAYNPQSQGKVQVLNAQGQPQYIPQFIQNPSQLNQSMDLTNRQTLINHRSNTQSGLNRELPFQQPLALDQDFFKDNLQNLNQALYGLFRKERDAQVKKDKQKIEQEERVHRIVSQQQEILTHLIKDLEEDRKRKQREQALENIYEQELNQNNYLDKLPMDNQQGWQFYNMMNPYAQQQVVSELVQNYSNWPNMPQQMPRQGMNMMPPPPLGMPQGQKQQQMPKKKSLN